MPFSKLLTPELLKAYRGIDWVPHVKYLVGAKCPFPITLWKTDTMELVLRGWMPHQYTSYYTNHNTVHTLWLEGHATYSLLPKLFITMPRFSQYTFITTPQFSQYKISNQDCVSTSLQLYEQN